MSELPEPVTILSTTECWSLASSVHLGRLVTSVDGQPEIFPINFAIQDHSVLFRTGEGTKLVSAVINDRVLFEVDGHDQHGGWSVIVKGFARVLRTADQLAEAEQARLRPWTGTDKEHVIRIRPLNVTGRRFVFAHTLDVS